MKKFEFDEKTHKYLINGKLATGVTTILGVIAKPALISWASRMASNYVLNNLKDLNDLERVCEEAKNAHRSKRDKAGNTGKATHEKCENWIRVRFLKLPPNETIEYDKLSEEEKKIADIMIDNFKDWATKNKVKFLASEKRLYNEELFIAGTVDALCEIGGKKYVLDIKTSSSIFDRVPMAQCAGYRLMLESMGEKDFKGSVIVNIKKSGEFNEERDVYYSYDYDTDKKIFLAALDIYRGLATFKVGNNKTKK